MATWSRNNRREAGFTLLEMLVALTIGAAAAGALAGLSRTVSPRVELTRAADQVAADFTRARAEARRTGRAVEVVMGEDGYAIAALGLEAAWPAAPETAPDRLIFHPAAVGGDLPDAPLVLSRRGERAVVEVAAVSGRVQVRIVE